MKLEMYSIYDSKVGAYLPPFFVPSRGAAVRAVQQAVNTDDHPFHHFPADYTLFFLGTWDDAQSFFDVQAPESVCNALTLVVDAAADAVADDKED